MSELNPDDMISAVDMATFLIDSRIDSVRKELFENFDDEDQQRMIATYLRVAYAHGLVDSFSTEIEKEVRSLGFRWPPR